jgi:hypothetical protein
MNTSDVEDEARLEAISCNYFTVSSTEEPTSSQKWRYDPLRATLPSNTFTKDGTAVEVGSTGAVRNMVARL